MKLLRKLVIVFILSLASITIVDADSCGKIKVTMGSHFKSIGEVRENRCIKWDFTGPETKKETGFIFDSASAAKAACVSIRQAVVDKEMVTIKVTKECELDETQGSCHLELDSIEHTNCYLVNNGRSCNNSQCTYTRASPAACYCGNTKVSWSKKNCEINECEWKSGEPASCSGKWYNCKYSKMKLTDDKKKCVGEYVQYKAAGFDNLQAFIDDCEKWYPGACSGCKQKYQGFYKFRPRACSLYSNYGSSSGEYISDLTAETFKIDDKIRAFCIHAEKLRPSKVTWASDFDVTACRSSLKHKTKSEYDKQCGYGNILIESAYLDMMNPGQDWNSSGVIEMALRLYAADSRLGRDGSFSRVGLPTSEANPDVSYASGSKNVYTTTIANLDKYIKSGKTWQTVASVNDLKRILCKNLPGGIGAATSYSTSGLNNKANGIMCSKNNSGSTNYLKAIYLYINTIQDQSNRVMMQHLYKLLEEKYGLDTISQYKPEEIKVTTVGEEVIEDKIEITYIINRNVEVECDKDDPATEKYCKANQILMFDIGGGKTILMTSMDGDYKNSPIETIRNCANNSKCQIVKVSPEEDLTHYDYCKKNRCYKTVVFTKVCNEQTLGQQRKLLVKVYTDKSWAEVSVKPLWACEKQSDYQVMYTFDPKAEIHNKPGDYLDDRTETIPPKVLFKCSCEPSTYYNKEGYTTAINAQSYAKATYTSNNKLTVYNKVTNELTSGNTCGIIDKNGNVVTTTKSTKELGTYGYGPYDTFDRSSVSDVSITKVLNMCYSGDKLQFDYSFEFGVNTDVCSIYCRDETDYYFANKTQAKAGMAFSYDLAKRLEGTNILKVIETQKWNNTTKKATSEYKLDKDVTEKFKNILGSSDKKFTTIVVAKRDCVSEIYYNKPNADGKKWIDLYNAANSGKKQQLIYDLQNCNLFSMNNSVEPVSYAMTYDDNKYSTIDYLKKLYACNSNASCKCDATSHDGMCGSMTLSYEETQKLGLNNPNMQYEMASEVSSIKYCTGNCYRINNLGNNNYGDVIGSLSESPAGTHERPSNDYAAFSIYTEIGYYISNRYYSVPLIGQITETKPSGKNVYSSLAAYSYPTSIKESSGTYNISSSYTMSTYDRFNKKRDIYEKLLNNGINKYACSYDVKNESTLAPPEPDPDPTPTPGPGDPKTPDSNCYVNGIYTPKAPDCPARLGFSFKNVDLANLFPSDKSSSSTVLNHWKAQYAINWDDTYGNSVQESIEATASRIFTDPELHDYSFTLSQDQINNLKRYNNEHTGYQTTVIPDNCEDPDKNNGIFLKCSDEFLREILEDSTSEYATVNHYKK